jgi:uncharacterized protein (DUF2062 family)
MFWYNWVGMASIDLRTECKGARREAAAVGVGVFIGCTPFYGVHFLTCRAMASMLGLNSQHVNLAASLSNPVFAPLLIFSELQTGALMRHGAFQSFTLAAIRTSDVWSLGLDYLLGVVAVGVALGTIAAAATCAATHDPSGDPMLAAIIQRASDRYLATSITAWEFACGKLRGDPVYRNTLGGGLLPSGRALVDVGCGQGLMLALLAEGHRHAGAGVPPAARSSFPQFDRLIGIEIRPRIARLARNALGTDAEILEQDARSIGTGSCSAVLFFDVLHLMSPNDQEAVVRTMAAALEPGGIILVRDGDASAGWRFAAVRIGNRLKALSSGIWRQKFHFRTKLEWIECFARLGLDADVRPMDEGTPFANVLFRLTVRAARLPPTSNSHEL